MVFTMMMVFTIIVFTSFHHDDVSLRPKSILVFNILILNELTDFVLV